MENLFHGRPELPELPVFGLRILMPTLAKEYRYEGLSGETYPDRKKGAHRGVSLKTDYDTIFGSAGMWNAYGYRMG